MFRLVMTSKGACRTSATMEGTDFARNDTEPKPKAPAVQQGLSHFIAAFYQSPVETSMEFPASSVT